MRPTRNLKRGASSLPKDGKQQQQISAMLGERVTKPRTFTDGMPPMLKRRKVDPAVTGSEVPAAKQPPTPSSPTVMAQKRKWRLSEIVERDREARKSRTQGAPAFVLLAPHMDSRRPEAQPQRQANTPVVKTEKKKKTLKQVKFWSSDDTVIAKAPVPSTTSCVYARETSAPKRDVRGSTSVPGGEAILYSRDMLPRSHVLLLDVLIGLESAMSLLKTRRTLPTVGAVREIVRRSTKRDFTLRILSQLAHVVPEAIAVLPGVSSQMNRKRASDGWIIRLEDVDLGEDGQGKNEKLKGVSSSVLGDSAARIRRSLLHKRLLQHVKEQHALFLKNLSISRHEGELWHEDFNLELDVEDLPAPPLYLEEVQNTAVVSKKKSPRLPTAEEQSSAVVTVDVSKNSPQGEAGKDTTVDDGEECIPLSLLEKVRARSKAREVHAANLEIEKSTNRSLLSKLPVTMDTICTILRGERRTAMGWSQLLAKVEKLHPKKWPKEDLDRQFDAIATLGSEWCKKFELKSSRGGFAFRVHSESSFVKARATVCSTTSYKPRN